MNILKLAKHLKEFTLDEIEMIAEIDCKTAINQLLNEYKIEFKNDKYYFIEKEKVIDYEIFTAPKITQKILRVDVAVEYFMQNYVKKHCKKWTILKYESVFKCNIIPFFKNKNLNDININEVKFLYEKFKELNFKPLRIKNTLALLNQLIKYFQTQGIIDRTCVFQVKRLTEKNKFSINRIIFEG